MFTKQFGLEIEFTGISREKAAETVAHYLGGTATITGDYYDTQKITAPDGRTWKLMYDGSINCQKKDGRRTVSAGSNYSVELVSPILLYREDIDMVQALARMLRKAGGFANKSCGIHIHLDGVSHTPRSIRNFINIIYAHNDLLYKALQIATERMRYCKKMDVWLVQQMNQAKPRPLRTSRASGMRNMAQSVVTSITTAADITFSIFTASSTATIRWSFGALTAHFMPGRFGRTSCWLWRLTTKP